MASFPTSVFSPSNKVPGQTIASAHMNDVQAEITAIEDGYRNATAPLNSSASTLASLHVTGNSTFAGNVTFSTYVSNLPPVCKVSLAAGIQFAAGAFVGVNWNQEDNDLANMHSTSADSSRIVFGSSGMWHCGYTVEWSSGGGGSERLSRLVLNDATPQAGYISTGVTQSQYPHNVSALVHVTNANEYVTVQVRPETTTGSIGTGSGYGTNFWAIRLR